MDSKPNILIVEKDETEINKFKTILGGISNLQIIETTTEAISHISDNRNKYHLIVTGLDMPVLNGYLFCYTIINDLKIYDIPLVITGNLIDFRKTEVTEGLRIGDYDKITRPYDGKLVTDIIEINIEKKKMIERLKAQGKFDEDTNLHSPEYFEELLMLELLRASKLETTLNCMKVESINEEIEANLISVIKSTCRNSDLACICKGKFKNKLIILLPRTADNEGRMIAGRINSVIYGLHITRMFFNPTTMSVEEFKAELFEGTMQNY